MVEPIVKWSDVEDVFKQRCTAQLPSTDPHPMTTKANCADDCFHGELCTHRLAYHALKQRRIDVCPTCRGEQQIGESWGKLRDCPDCDDGWVRRG